MATIIQATIQDPRSRGLRVAQPCPFEILRSKTLSEKISARHNYWNNAQKEDVLAFEAAMRHTY